MATKLVPIGTLIDDIWAQREAKRELEAKVKAIEDVIASQEILLMERLEKEGIDKSTGKKASVSVSENIVANIVDWDLFTSFVKKTGYFHLIQRRTSDLACRELFEKKGKIPGLEPFKKKRVNIRTLTQ